MKGQQAGLQKRAAGSGNQADTGFAVSGSDMVAFVEAENSIKQLSVYESCDFEKCDTRQTISKES